MAIRSKKRFDLTFILTIIFIVLKLTGYIQWSWLWVLSPIWISALLMLSLVVILIVLPVFMAMLIDFLDRIKK